MTVRRSVEPRTSSPGPAGPRPPGPPPPVYGASIALTGRSRATAPVGRCTHCGRRIGAPPHAVELVAVVAALLVVLAVPRTGPAVVPALVWWAVCAVPLVFVDLAVHRLPDRLTVPAAAGTWLLLGVAAALTAEPGRWLRAVAAGLLVGLLFTVSTLLLGRRGFGLGDAKLALSCAALLGWSGWGPVLLGLLAAFLASGGTALLLLIVRRARWAGDLAFGPFLVLGTVVALAVTI